jgi:hypothetical protein
VRITGVTPPALVTANLTPEIMKTYKEQSEEIKKLAESIISKSEKFASDEHKSPYFEDLAHVIAELKSLDSFLK